jgi:hypothetical protein
MEEFLCKEWQVLALLILLENVSYYFVLRYLIADAEIVLCCAGYSHKIH